MKRQSKNLASSLEHRLSGYALAASAAGVSVLALAQPAEAKIVYTKTHHVIDLKHNIYNLDLNNDGVVDFLIRVESCKSGTSCPEMLLHIGGYSNSVAFRGRSTSGTLLADDFKGGAVIPGKDYFYRGALLAGSKFRDHYNGNWFNVNDRYLGLAFYTRGEKHYGWARMNVRTHRHPFTVTGTLTGYAYETIPNKPIIAGKTHGKDVVTIQPATLGHLARGASAISTWRKAGGNK